MSGTTAIQAATTAAILTILSFGAARADTYHFKDTLRPNGVERGMDAKRADGRACGSDENNKFSNVAAFKSCMRRHGWVADRYIPDPPAPRVAAGARDRSYIDPDTGMSCKNTGGVAVCDPPNGTVHYRNDEGLSCTRTGIVSVCSNF